MKIKSGVSPYEGVTTQWYGWAEYASRPESGYEEGPIRFLRIWARLDAWRLARKLRRQAEADAS